MRTPCSRTIIWCAGAHPAAQAWSTIWGIRARIVAQPCVVITCLSEGTFNAGAARQAQSGIIIASGVCSVTLVNSANFKALAFKASFPIGTFGVVINFAIAIVIDAITDFFGVQTTQSAQTTEILVHNSVTVIIVAITCFHFFDKSRNACFYTHLAYTIANGTKPLLTRGA
jgi:hypothetical protein